MKRSIGSRASVLATSVTLALLVSGITAATGRALHAVTGSGICSTTPAPSSGSTVVTVRTGVPTLWAFRLSSGTQSVRSDRPAVELAVPVGVVTFTVCNPPPKSYYPHDFKVCTAPQLLPLSALRGSPSPRSVVAGLPNSCTGVTTPVLKPGAFATLIVTFTMPGRYEYLCTVPGHAAAGMKGLLDVT